MFIKITNLYSSTNTEAVYLMKDEHRIIYIRPKDVRYLNGTINDDGSSMTEIILYNGDRFCTGLNIHDVRKLISVNEQ